MDTMKEPEVRRGQSRRDVLQMAAASVFGLTLGDLTIAADASSHTGTSLPIQSAGAMTFGSNDTLFVADVKGASIYAFALRPSDLTSQTDIVHGNFHNFEGRDLVTGVDQKLAAMFGTTVDKVVINDMVVHQPTQQVFFSVERGRSVNALPAIIKLNHGRLEVLKLDDIPHSRTPIPNEPSPSAMLEFDPQRMYAITDVKHYNGEVFVTGVSNQRFASTLHRIPYPFKATMTTSTMEIWHSTHGEFETRAPIIRQLIRETNGEPYLYGVYGCTPLVRFPLSSLTNGAHVRGELIGELGYGCNPLDMLTFVDPFDKKEYLLVTMDTRGGKRIAVTDMDAAPVLPTGGGIDFGPLGLGKTERDLPIHAEHTAILNSQFAVLIWRHPKTSYRLDISTLVLPYFFERKDGMSEMNWPNGPDPFDYRAHHDDSN